MTIITSFTLWSSLVFSFTGQVEKETPPSPRPLQVPVKEPSPSAGPSQVEKEFANIRGTSFPREVAPEKQGSNHRGKRSLSEDVQIITPRSALPGDKTPLRRSVSFTTPEKIDIEPPQAPKKKRVARKLQIRSPPSSPLIQALIDSDDDLFLCENSQYC